MKFSQRMGITPTSKSMQIESLDDDLKNSLWNVYELLLGSFNPNDGYVSSYDKFVNEDQRLFARSLWHNFFKWTIDTSPHDRFALRATLKEWFFKCRWFEIYDIIQFSTDHISRARYNISHIIDEFNTVLERDNSAYRFIQGQISKITNKHEIEQLTDLLKLTESFTALKGCNIHLNSALQMLSDRLNPDYRNSIKESVSGIESLVKVLSEKEGDSMNGALDRIKGKIKLNSKIEIGFKNLYHYSSTEGGIRHALMDEPNCDYEDAKYMLVSCSAFINYLISKANKAGITF